MNQTALDFLDQFPFLKKLPAGAWIVGGTARYLTGLTSIDPKDIDIRCSSGVVRRKVVSALPPHTDVTPPHKESIDGSTSLQLTASKMVVDLWSWDSNPNLEDYLRNVPLNIDAVAVRTDGDILTVRICSDALSGEVTERDHDDVIRTASANQHIRKYRGATVDVGS